MCMSYLRGPRYLPFKWQRCSVFERKPRTGTIAAFGCKAFALLFYDIDRELSTSDKGDFQSSACAEVSVTNKMFEPEFYFCPTEYCTSRAMATLSASEYLNTAGSKLLTDVYVLWSGA